MDNISKIEKTKTSSKVYKGVTPFNSSQLSSKLKSAMILSLLGDIKENPEVVEEQSLEKCAELFPLIEIEKIIHENTISHIYFVISRGDEIIDEKITISPNCINISQHITGFTAEGIAIDLYINENMEKHDEKEITIEATIHGIIEHELVCEREKVNIENYYTQGCWFQLPIETNVCDSTEKISSRLSHNIKQWFNQNCSLEEMNNREDIHQSAIHYLAEFLYETQYGLPPFLNHFNFIQKVCEKYKYSPPGIEMKDILAYTLFTSSISKSLIALDPSAFIGINPLALGASLASIDTTLSQNSDKAKGSSQYAIESQGNPSMTAYQALSEVLKPSNFLLDHFIKNAHIIQDTVKHTAVHLHKLLVKMIKELINS